MSTLAGEPAAPQQAIVDTMRAAQYLGIGQRTLDNWRSQGRGPRYIRIGSRIYYRIVHLEEYVKANTVDSEFKSGH